VYEYEYALPEDTFLWGCLALITLACSRRRTGTQEPVQSFPPLDRSPLLRGSFRCGEEFIHLSVTRSLYRSTQGWLALAGQQPGCIQQSSSLSLASSSSSWSMACPIYCSYSSFNNIAVLKTPGANVDTYDPTISSNGS
jgi:hypothetical protein